MSVDRSSRTYGPGLLPQMRHELQGREEADSAGRREVVAEHDRRIERIAAAAKVSGYRGELDAEPDYRAWERAAREAAGRGQDQINQIGHGGGQSIQ